MFGIEQKLLTRQSEKESKTHIFRGGSADYSKEIKELTEPEPEIALILEHLSWDCK